MMKITAILLGLSFYASMFTFPNLVKFEHMKISKINFRSISLTVDAIYYNPNIVGSRMEDMDVDLWVNGTNVGKIEAQQFDMNPKSEFVIPMTINIPTNVLIKDKFSMIGELFKAIKYKEIPVQYKGKVKINFLGAKINYPISDLILINLSKKTCEPIMAKK